MKKFFFILSIILTQSLFATTWYAIQDGDWNDDNTWDDGGFMGMFASNGHPQDGDIAVIEYGYSITVGDSNATCDSLYMYNADDNVLTINSGKELTIKNGIYVNGYSDNHSNYIKVYGTLTVTNRNIYIRRYDDGWYDIQLYANNGTINVGGDIVYYYQDGPEWESYKEFDFEGSSSISCTNVTITKTDDYDEGLPEIYMSGSSQWNISGNFTVTEGDGDGYKLTMEGSSQINISGNSKVDITSTSGGKDITIALSGTSAFKIGSSGTSHKDTIRLNSGEDISFKLSDDASYTVYGDLYFDQSANQDFLLLLNDGTDGSANDAQLDIKNNLNIHLDTTRDVHIYTYHDADIKVGNDFTVTQTSFISTNADLIFDQNEESGITVSGNSTVNFTATGNNNDLLINIDNDAFWKTTANVAFDYNGDDDFLINLNQNADGSSDDAQFTANGNMTLTGHNSLRYFKLLMNNNSDLIVGNNFTITLSGNEDWEDNTISVADDAGITVGGDYEITSTSSYKSRLYLYLYNNAFWTIGTNGHTSDNLTINYNAAYQMLLKLYDSSSLTVYGDLTLDRQNGDSGQDCEMNTYTSSHVTIYDDLILKNTQDSKLMKLTLTDNAIVEVKDDIDFSNAPSDQRLQLETWSSSKLYIGGNFLRNSTNKYGVLSCNESSTLYYNGTTQQQEIAANAGAGSDEFTYANVVLNNTTSSSPQFTMEGTSEIRDGYDLKFTDGIVLADATHYFKILDNATVSDASSASFVDGYIHKIGNDAFTFPIGNNVYYAPALISAPSNTTDEFSARYRFEDPDNAGDRTKHDASLDHISHQEYWNIDRTVGSSSINLTLTWAEPRTGGIDDISEIRIAHWNSSKWEDYGSDATTGDTATGSITVNNINSFSPFTLASINSDNPLPVELISFTAKKDEEVVNLNWITESEINNDYFIVEKSSNGIDFEEIQKIYGAGNSEIKQYYTAVDDAPYEGTTYYRLKQVDFDGSTSYSNIRTVYFSNILKDEVDFIIFPNPSSGLKDITIQISNFDDKTNLSIIDISGKIIIDNYPINNYKTNINHNLLHKGIYIVSITSEYATVYKKLIIQ